MHEWCQRIKDKPRTLYIQGERLRGGYIYPDTPWSRAEAEATRVCQKYGQACLSVHRALDQGDVAKLVLLVRAGGARAARSQRSCCARPPTIASVLGAT